MSKPLQRGDRPRNSKIWLVIFCISICHTIFPISSYPVPMILFVCNNLIDACKRSSLCYSVASGVFTTYKRKASLLIERLLLMIPAECLLKGLSLRLIRKPSFRHGTRSDISNSRRHLRHI